MGIELRHKRRNARPVIVAALLGVLVVMAARPTKPVVATEAASLGHAATAPECPPPTENGAADALARMAADLGWATDLEIGVADHGFYWRVTSGPLSAEIRSAPLIETCAPLDRLAARGHRRGVFYGWQAIVSRAGDSLPDGSVCTEGIIAWRAGPLVCKVQDDAGDGGERAVARALYRAVQPCVAGTLPSSVIILAETGDTPGYGSLAQAHKLRRVVHDYFGVVSRGRATFDFLLVDADGPEGGHDWHCVGDVIAAFERDETGLAIAALHKGLEPLDLPSVVHLERVIVLVPWDADAEVATCAIWQPRDYPIQVTTAAGVIDVYVPNIVVACEGDEAGAWIHEVGHSLHARPTGLDGFARVRDLYTRGETAGAGIGPWGLMGNWSERPDLIDSPPHMCSYTLAEMGWGHPVEVGLGHPCTLTALEHQAGDLSALRWDDPLSDDPECYYMAEARDRDATQGAPGTGVVIYHVSRETGTGRARVTVVPPEQGSAHLDQPTLAGADNDGEGNTVVHLAGMRVSLLAEDDLPYRATICIDR